MIAATSHIRPPKRTAPGSSRGSIGSERGRLVVVRCLATFGFLLVASSARAQTIDPDLWGVDNRVFAVARSGNTLYVGGAFRRVGPCTGGAVALPKHCANPGKPFPKVTGYVYTIAADGEGGWFLAGNFTAVGGVPRYSLAHVLADGTIAPWNPNPNREADGVFVADNTVYVVGLFATISGKSRQYIAALDAKTGAALDWDAHSNGIAIPLAFRGSTLYVGGLFSQIGGQPRNNIAALDATSGAATGWNPDADGGVWSVAIRGKRLYVGGSFTRIGAKSRSLVAELDPETGLATDWNPTAQGPHEPYVNAMVMHGGTLFVGGSFTSIGGQVRNGLAAFETRTGELTAWDPGATAARGFPDISILRAHGRSIYVGGYFQSIGGQPRNYVAELDAFTGAATDWNPDPSNVVYAIAVGENTVCIGGTFKSMGMVPRRNLAAFDLTTGKVTDWNPNPDGLIVYALAASEGKIYAGGDFTQIGGQFRSDLAALDALTGAATEWNPGADQAVRALLVNGNTIYVGGGFSHAGGQPRRYVAALDATTGAATAWNPSPDDGVVSLSLRGSTVYAGGWFYRIGGLPRRSLAAVDAATGAVLPWRADTDGVVDALAISGNTVYAGGVFERVNGQNRRNLVAIDAGTGAVKPWDPSPDGAREDAYTASVNAIATSGNMVFVGGDFTIIGGQPRAGLAALDGVTGKPLEWSPNPDQSVWALMVGGSTLYAGGFLQAAQNVPHAGLIAVSLPGTIARAPEAPIPVLRVVSMAPISPNPARSSAVVRYTLPRAAPVSLEVFDLQGRRIETILGPQLQEPGEHEIRVATDRLPTGCYLYRLDAGGVIATQKVVVVR